MCVSAALALTGALGAQTPPQNPIAPETTIAAPPSQPIRPRDRKRAAKLYLEGSKEFENGQFEEAMHSYETAAALVPDSKDYTLAAQVARSHAVTALIQNAAKDRAHGDAGAARAALEKARALDPNNPLIAEHVSELATDVAAAQPRALYDDTDSSLGESPRLQPASGVQSFHFKTDRRAVIQRVYKAFGIDTTMDQSVPAPPMRFDLENATFAQATEAVAHATDTFAVPLDAHRVVVALDTRQNRQLFERQDTETLYLPGLTAAELTEVSNIAKNVFNTTQLAVAESRDTITVRAPAEDLDAFNSTMHDLMDGRSQVMLDVQIIQLAHTTSQNIGVQLPQQVTAFNAYAEEQAILNANQALVQQIISSGLAAPGDTLAILGILLASGQVSSSIFSNGIALFGGGITLSGISPGATTLNLNLNSSDSRALDNVQLRLADGQEETFRSGTRYPILVASYSGLNLSGVNIPGLTTAGASGSLASLASALAGAQSTIPQVQYQDLGLTLKATPKVMRSGDVALTLDLSLTALSGSSANGNPILDNRAFSGVITLKEGHGALLMSEVDEQESRAISGTPGLNEIPGLSGADDKDTQKDYATLLIVLTPHVIQGPTSPGHTPMLRLERGSVAP
jgi:Flp pilus assembly secretin CpaC